MCLDHEAFGPRRREADEEHEARRARSERARERSSRHSGRVVSRHVLTIGGTQLRVLCASWSSAPSRLV